ncbi:glutathione S-transferase Mu 1 [Ixodes scapularis]|uniref:glutathione S-transferase Mu 1 n=1 Tax=Ixodes scapularis TaxID=6945 RepID=UPI001A9EB0E5|nr:glutathione S-transferase Mu 1 [Ixodes scapularis]
MQSKEWKLRSVSNEPIFGYWKSRRLGHPIRNLLVFKGVNFQEKLYLIHRPLQYFDAQWLSEKPHLDLKFPNLPYYFEGDVKLTQSLCILRHLGRKHNLAAETEAETTELDVLEQQATDLCESIREAAFSPVEPHSMRPYEDRLDEVLGPWMVHLEGRQWVLGDRLTYVDFLLYEGLDWHRLWKADVFKNYPTLDAYVRKFEDLPNLKTYFQSQRYFQFPIFGPRAKWGFNECDK